MSQQATIHPTLEANAALQAWRERALQVTLMATMGASVIPLLTVLLETLHVPSHWPAALVFLVACLALIPLLALRRLDHCLRAWGFLVVGYVTAGLAMARGGLAGSGRVYLLALPIAAIVLVGVRSGIAAALLSLLTYGGFTLAAGQGWLRSWLVHPESLLHLSNWLSEGAAFAMLLTLVTLLVGLLIREQARTLVRAEQSRAELAAAHRRTLAAREEERKQLARELHDLVLQELFRLGHRLDWCKREAGKGKLKEELAEVWEANARQIQQIRRICTALRPPALDLIGLTQTMRRHAEAFADRQRKAGNPLILELDLAETRDQLSEEAEIALFRVFQEGLSNVERHAQASKIEIGLALTPDEVLLTIQDDGCGFAVPYHLGDGSTEFTTGLAQEGCLGLLGARERMEALGGGLEVTSRPGKGTLLQAWALSERARKSERKVVGRGRGGRDSGTADGRPSGGVRVDNEQ